jgi:glyceraldehyde-3-phosphate dehydrogenase (NADP+)
VTLLVAHVRFSEFATLFIPAVIMGNTIVFKTPRVGGLVHMPLLEAYRDCFPPGVVNVVHGSGRECFTPVMKQGGVSILAFIGTHSAAQSLHQAHPHPFTVRLALGLDAKNPAIVTAKADLDVAASEIVLGSLSYNGQRCTAVKITFVHESVADELVKRLKAGIEKLVLGLPWDKGVGVTPVAEPAKPKYHADVIADAVAKGATVVTGNKFDRTLCAPTLLYPCTLDMRICVEEQFGPVVPIVRYKNECELESYFIGTEYGQQASVFTTDATEVPRLLDFLAHHVTVGQLMQFCVLLTAFAAHQVGALVSAFVFDLTSFAVSS